jgi:hypothetical protein
MSKVGFVELTRFSLEVTKELLKASLASIVSRPDYNPLLNTDMVVTLSKRMQSLRSFLETIPEQFRSPLISKRNPLETSKGLQKEQKSNITFLEPKGDGILPITGLD